MLIAVTILRRTKGHAAKDREAIHNSISHLVISHQDRYNRYAHLSSHVAHLSSYRKHIMIKRAYLLVVEYELYDYRFR